jgi:hypothetical protein
LKKIAIHQPNFLPWLGYFYKIATVDLFVFLDDVQYTKNSFINRNKIRAGNDSRWLTCPVATSGEFGQAIKDVRYYKPKDTEQSILGILQANYKKTPNYNRYIELIRSALNLEKQTLANQNIILISAVSKELNIPTRMIRSSELDGIEGTATSRLISICKETGANVYLAGFGAAKYQEDELFQQEGITVTRSEFVHPVYNQVGPGFISNLSVVDFLFNAGNNPFLTL